MKATRPISKAGNKSKPAPGGQFLVYRMEDGKPKMDVRFQGEPFPTQTKGAKQVFGHVTAETPLILESRMAENGVIFSDGIEKDFLEFNSGTQAVIGIAERKGLLVE